VGPPSSGVAEFALSAPIHALTAHTPTDRHACLSSFMIVLRAAAGCPSRRSFAVRRILRPHRRALKQVSPGSAIVRAKARSPSGLGSRGGSPPALPDSEAGLAWRHAFVHHCAAFRRCRPGDRHIARIGTARTVWGSAGIAAWDNRLFVRNNDYLWRIGDPNKPFQAPDQYAK
jgi:hypothetical protein